MPKKIPDVDIDFKDRTEALEELLHIPASRVENQELKKHNVGVYFHSIPQDPLTGLASIPHKEANARGFFKLDFLNLHVYKQVRDEDHLNELVAREPVWAMLEDEQIVEQLFQLGNWAELTVAYAPKNIYELAMVLAVIRPGKQHLMGLEFSELEKDIWVVDPDADDEYFFKKAHAISYAYVVVVQMNLMWEQAFGA